MCFTLSFFLNLPFKIHVEGKDGCPDLSQKQQCRGDFLVRAVEKLPGTGPERG